MIFTKFSILLALSFVLWLDFLCIQEIIEKGLASSFILILFLIPLFKITKSLVSLLIEKYITSRTDYFFDNYIFPKELSIAIKEKYPHLNRSEVKEVLMTLKNFYRLEIDEEVDLLVYMPSRVVEYASQVFLKMPESASFVKNIKLFNILYPKSLEKSASKSDDFIPILLTDYHDKKINNSISKTWYSYCKVENIDPFFPLVLPSFFTLDKRLKIPLGYLYVVDEVAFREMLSIENAPSIFELEDDMEKIEDLEYLAKKIRYYLGNHNYCLQHEYEDLKDFLDLIDQFKPLAHAVYGRYNDADLFKITVLNNASLQS